MPTITIELSPDLHKRLSRLASAADKPLEDYTRDLLIALNEQPPLTPRDQVKALLQAAGLPVLPSDALLTDYASDDIPSLEEIVEEMSKVSGPSLTEILEKQRGPKP